MLKRILSLCAALALLVVASACGQSAAPASSAAPAPASAAAPAESNSAATSAPAAEIAKPDNWPVNPLSLIVPAAVGSNMDVKARLVAQYLPKYLDGATVIVDNRPGASGITALTEYLLEKPNTSALLFASGSHMVINPYYNDVMYKMEDFIPLACTDEVENGLFVNPDMTGIKTLEDLVAYGKDKIVKFGASGTGDTFLMTKAILTMAGLQSDVVDASSANEYLVNCLAGHVDVAYAGMTLANDFIAENKLVPIGVFSEQPYTGYDGITVPTFKEQGYDVVHTAFTYFSIRAGTDQAIVDYIQNALTQVLKDPDFVKAFTEAGFVVVDDPSPAAIQKKLDTLSKNLTNISALIGE